MVPVPRFGSFNSDSGAHFSVSNTNTDFEGGGVGRVVAAKVFFC